MKPIGSLTNPYVRKVCIVFNEKKVDVDLELENVWAADTKIGATNPLGKVPCLISDDGDAIRLPRYRRVCGWPKPCQQTYSRK